MKQKKKFQSGITLIALVITIIVLLILAGVSLSLVVGQNGVLNKAQDSVTETKKAKLEEEVQFVLAEWETDYLVNQTAYEGRTATTPSGAEVICSGGNLIVIDSSSDKIYTSTFENGVMGELQESDGTTKESQAYKAMHPKVPSGFTHIEGDWNTGFVIKDGKGDEFVWIPVVSEASYARKSGSKNWHMSASGTDDSGVDVTQYILGDKLELSEILGTPITETKRTGETPANMPEATVVNSVGGFYVSRYEIGIESAERTSGTQANIRNASTQYFSQAGKEPVRRISQRDSLAIANNWKKGNDFQSGLITGTQWDTMCNFIGWSECDSDCTNWGNYDNINSKSYANEEVWHSKFEKDSGLELWINEAIQKGNSNVIANRDKTDTIIFATGKFENANGGRTDKKIFMT